MQVVEAARLYEAGWSSGRIADEFEVSADNVLRSLRKAASPSGHSAAGLHAGDVLGRAMPSLLVRGRVSTDVRSTRSPMDGAPHGDPAPPRLERTRGRR
jgi:hypothetical protein